MKNKITMKKDIYSGFKGKLIIILMNFMHRPVNKWLVNQMDLKSGDKVLDIGCGGGELIFLLARGNNLKAYGIDYSSDMVRAAKKNNQIKILSGDVKIVEASVSDIPYDNNEFDNITAFETIQFWPDIINDLKEVKRTLKENGKFHIMNRLPTQNSRWYEFSQLKAADDYKKALEIAGFIDIEIDIESKKGWIYTNAAKA